MMARPAEDEVYTQKENAEHERAKVNTGLLIAKTRDFIRRYVVLSQFQSLMVALWVLHTHAFEAFDTTPYLWINSPEKRSGKTLLLELLDLLVPNPWLTSRVTIAVIARKIDQGNVTMLFDEVDTVEKGDKEAGETIRSILNSGYKKNGKSSVCVGKDFKVKDLRTFCAKAIAGIGKLWDTVVDRSIPIKLKPKTTKEIVQRFRQRDGEVAASPLRIEMATWAAQHKAALRESRPALPDELNSRAQDVCEPLFAIADLGGGEWPEKVREAALAVYEADVEQSLGVQLLRDIRSIFESLKLDDISSGELADKLFEIEDSPWGFNDKAPSKKMIANKLKPFDIHPTKYREGKDTPRGYKRAQFEDAWNRYVCVTPDSNRHNRNNVVTTGFSAYIQPEQEPPAVPDANGQKPNNHGLVPDVPDKSPVSAQEDQETWR